MATIGLLSPIELTNHFRKTLRAIYEKLSRRKRAINRSSFLSNEWLKINYSLTMIKLFFNF